jgi:hypothetical protein
MTQLINRPSPALTFPSSWPGLSRPSTPLMRHGFQGVDARDKRGHDESGTMTVGITG